jgi:uncharacterized protein YjbI with pentapeptide repeats
VEVKLGEVRKWPGWNRLARGAGILALTLGAPFALWRVPKWQVADFKNLTREQRFDRENEARKTLAQIIGGIAVLLGAYYTWRNIKNAERSQLENQKTAQETLRISLEGQITDRFTKAIEQLGSDRLEIRLGGIYALERIARDSERDHWPIMEILTAYVRGRSPRDESKELIQYERPPAPAPDVQAIITVLGRREKKHEKHGEFLDLHNCNLSSAALDKGDFSGASFTESCLDYTTGSGTNFSDARFIRATLRSATLVEANLSAATLAKANLAKCSLVRSNLTGAILVDAVLTGALLDSAQLRGAFLSDVLGLDKNQIARAEVDQNTMLPAYLTQSEPPTPEAES